MQTMRLSYLSMAAVLLVLWSSQWMVVTTFTRATQLL
jgi:hypothetical protein